MKRANKSIIEPRRIALSIAAMLLLVAGPMARAQEPAARPAAAGNVENGKKLYKDVGCWQCHGYAAQGGGGPKIGPNPLPLAGLMRYIRKPSGQMPPYTAKVLKDSEVADIHAFLQTIPKSPDPSSIPLLNQ